MKSHFDINYHLDRCLKNNIIIYPEVYGYKFKICVKIGNENPIVYNKILESKEVNSAMTKTIIYYSNKI